MTNIIKTPRSVFRYLLVLLVLFSATSYASNDDDGMVMSVKSKPDVVIETLTMLMPVTTKAALEVFPIEFFNGFGAGDLITSHEDVDVNYEDPYEPYLNKKHEEYNKTVLYKMEYPTDGASMLPVIKNFGFERALFAANHLFWYICVFFVAIAAGRMAWVSMTVEDESKAYKKMIALIPVLGISLVLVNPVADGYTYAQLILVWAFIASNYLASLVSMIGSVELYNHVINSYSDMDEDEPLRGTVSQNVPTLFDNLSKQTLIKLTAENSMDSTVKKLLDGDKLTSVNLNKAIDRYNKEKVKDPKYNVTEVCFGENWPTELSNNVSCSMLRQDRDLPLKNLVFRGSAPSKIKDFGAINERYNPELSEAFDSIYSYVKSSYCMSKAKNYLSYTPVHAEMSFICKKRDSGGRFVEGGDYFGFSKGEHAKLLPVPEKLDHQKIGKILYEVYYAAMEDSASEVPENKLDTSFKNRGFFISPLESVYVAIKTINNRKEVMGRKGLKKAAGMTEAKLQAVIDRIVPVAIEAEVMAHLANNRTNSLPLPYGELSEMDFSQFGGLAPKAIDTLGLWKELTASIFDFSDVDSDLEGASKNDQVVIGIFEENKLKTIEPYSKLTTTYYSLLPLSIAAYAGGKILTGDQQTSKVSVNRFAAGKLLTTMGGLMFFTALACKVIGGLLFLSFAISLLISSFKRLIISLISAQVIVIKFLKDGFDETRDDDDNLVVSKYLINASVRIFIDLPMIFIAILCSYIIGTFSANLISFMFIIFGSTSMSLTELSVSSIAASIFFFIGLFVCIIWGLYQGMQLMGYVHKKGTDFVDDATGVSSDQAENELMSMIKSTLMPSRYIN